MTIDWIDKEKQQRDQGITSSLLQSEHVAVNVRYPGCTLEYCSKCDQLTGKAGYGEDSNYTNNGDGPYCDECWDLM